MNTPPRSALAIALLAVALGGPAVRAGEGPARADLTAETRRAVLDAISRTLIDGYIYEDVARKMADALRRHAQAGRYDDLKAPAAFAARSGASGPGRRLVPDPPGKRPLRPSGPAGS